MYARRVFFKDPMGRPTAKGRRTAAVPQKAPREDPGAPFAFYSILRYWSSCKTVAVFWLAWASMALADWTRILFLV